MKKDTKFWIALAIVLGIAVSSQLLGQDVYDSPEEVDKAIQKEEQRNQRADREIIRQELVRNRIIANEELRRFEERHKKLHQKDKSLSNSRLVISYVLVGAAGYYLGYLASKEHMKKGKKAKMIGKQAKDDWRKI
jgi:Mg2+ and Co2+ transporter CorA|tara:strand:+ start:332 stop:736 length:405 start_codon:yes stop_codon:yes gene_type:complete